MPLKKLFMFNKLTDMLDCATKCNYIMKSKKLLSLQSRYCRHTSSQWL